MCRAGWLIRRKSGGQPLSINEAKPEDLRQIRGVCLDIDDTLSTEGKLTAQAFSALWQLYEAGFAVVPITGRPAGWCDQIARFWPVHAVIGENGAFAFFMQDGVRRRIETPAGMPREMMQKKLARLFGLILKEFPKARVASDQGYREFDLAIDICEDVAPWQPQEIERLLKLCHNEGAHAKLSSIHINTWFGAYDKKSGFEHWILQGAPGLGPNVLSSRKKFSKQHWLFIGDSPNDEPMFEFFGNSVGVANLSRYFSSIKSLPKWITPSSSGKGFAEMSTRLIQSRLPSRQ